MRQYRQHQLLLLRGSGIVEVLLLLLLSITILTTTNTCSVNAFHIVQQQLQQTSLLQNTISIDNSLIQQKQQQNRCTPVRNSLQLFMASGMGMGSSSSGKKTSKKTGSTDTKSKGMGNSNSKKQGSTSENDFNVQSSMSRLEKKYEEILKQHTKTLRNDDDNDDDDSDVPESDDNEIRTSEYVIAARAIGYVDDWVPIAQLIIARTVQFTKQSKSKSKSNTQEQQDIICNKLLASSSISTNDKLLLLSSISIYRRELFFSACLGSRIFNSIPRDKVQYSIESIDSFHKYIYDTIIDTNPSTSTSASNTNMNNANSDSNNVQNTMTKQQARDVLLLTEDNNNDWDTIKKQYRTLSFKYHPDRFVGSGAGATTTTTMTDTETETQTDTTTSIEDATEQFHKVRLAYETLQSGRTSSSTSTSTNTVLSSWYASLGGKARTDFIGPLQLMSMNDSIQYFNTAHINSDDDTTTSSTCTTSTAICPVNPSMVQMFVTRATTMSAASATTATTTTTTT